MRVPLSLRLWSRICVPAAIIAGHVLFASDPAARFDCWFETPRIAASREISLLRRPWIDSGIDRRRAAQAQNILQHLGAGEKLRLATRWRHHLQSDRQARRGESARQRQGRAADQRDGIDDAEPLDVIVEFLARAFGDIAVLDRKRRDDGRRRQQQIVGSEKIPACARSSRRAALRRAQAARRSA